MSNVLNKLNFIKHLKTIIVFCIIILIHSISYSQSFADYRTRSSGDNATSRWSCYVIGWSNAIVNPDYSLANVITIRNTYTIRLTSNITYDQLVIESGGSLIINPGVTLTINNGSGIDLENNGTITNNGTIIINSSAEINNKAIIVNNGTITNSGTITNTGSITHTSTGIYNHKQNGGAIPVSTWDIASFCNITGITNSAPSGLNQNFGNFTWNSPSHSGTINLNGNLTTVNGSFRLQNAGSGVLTLGNASGTLTIGQNFLLESGTLNINSGTGTSNVNVNGNVTFSGGVLTETGSSVVNFNFSGSSLQTFIKTGGTISNSINFIVNSSAIVSFGTSVLNGTNATFTSVSGSTIKTAHGSGFASSGALGTVQVGGTRTYSTGTNFEYNGSVPQVTGTGLNQNIPANVTINSSNTVTLSNAVIISGNLLIAAGTFSTSTSNYGFSLSGNFTNNGIFNANASIVTFQGNINTLINGTSSTQFYNLVIDKSSSSSQVQNSVKAFSCINYLRINQGNIILEATDVDYNIGGDVVVTSLGTLSHNVNWNTFTKKLSIGGNLQIDGIWNYSVRSHVQMYGVDKTIRTGSNSLSALCILTLINNNFYASGKLVVNDNFWSMFGTAGSFHTNGCDVYANAAMLINGGTVYVDGGTLNVTNGLYVSMSGGLAGTLRVSLGTCNVDVLQIGDGSVAGTFIQSGGLSNFTGNITVSNGSFSISDGTVNSLQSVNFGTGVYPVTYTQTGGEFLNSAPRIRMLQTNANISSGIFAVYGLELGNGLYNSVLNHSGGTVEITSEQLKIFNGSTYNCSSSPIIKINRDFYNLGSFVNASSTLILQGDVSQQIYGSSTIDFGNVTIANTSGGVTIATPINIWGVLTLTSGIVATTSVNVITMKNGATTTIGSSTCYINGPMNFEKASVGSTTFNIPIGRSGDWRPVELTVNHATSTSYTYKTEMLRLSASEKGWSLPSDITHVSHVRYWTINRFASSDLNTQVPSVDLSGNQTISLYYGINDFVDDPAYLRVCKGTASSWVNIGGIGAVSGIGKVTSTSTPTAFNSFSDFTLGNASGGNNELPIELVDFHVNLDLKGIVFNWETSTETDNDFFTIEYSTDGVSFNSLCEVDAVGNSTTTKLYEYILNDYKFSGIVYFRLKQTDFNGHFTYSDVIIQTILSNELEITLFPIPAIDYISIQYSDVKIQNILFFNESLQIIKLPQINFNSYSVNGLAPGVYFVKIITESGMYIKRFVK